MIKTTVIIVLTNNDYEEKTYCTAWTRAVSYSSTNLRLVLPLLIDGRPNGCVGADLSAHVVIPVIDRECYLPTY